MRYGHFLFLLFCLLNNATVQAQQALEKGAVSYVSSQNVYVKFASTKGINIGDTLFLQKGENLLPALRVTNKSSVSCVCSKLTTDPVPVATEIVARVMPEAPKPEGKQKPAPKTRKEQVETQPAPGQDKTPEQLARETEGVQESKYHPKQKIRARLSAASYSNFSDSRETTRMRYSFSMQGNNIQQSKFSTDVYVVFRHTLHDWAAVDSNLFDALKIYALSVKYDFSESTNLVLGRKINPKIASLGAVDGLQFEKGIGHFYFGAIGGARPDLSDYSINPDLLQAGVYFGLGSKQNEKYHQSTLGIIEQRNKSAVDRRFVYFQHTDDLMKNLNLFGSMEVDLYQNFNNEVQNKPSLTNLFVSLRYRFSRNLNAMLSYDNRKNIIYYESYKSYIDQIIDQETRQGLRFGMSFRPVKLINVGANASWRFQKSNANEAKNLNTYLNFNQIPGIKTSAMLTANFLQTSYINSRIYGLRLMKDMFKGKVNTELYYRRVDYDFPVYGFKSNQNVVGAGISWQILKKLGFYVFFEQTFDSQGNDFLLVNTRLMQRF
ncbi:MAG: hypothetical protein L6Q97_20765 [Thermoanaerobaculia bacterium]|nr:hypothetical protein [Thermoanaerobaculia bacterium]